MPWEFELGQSLKSPVPHRPARTSPAVEQTRSCPDPPYSHLQFALTDSSGAAATIYNRCLVLVVNVLESGSYGGRDNGHACWNKPRE